MEKKTIDMQPVLKQEKQNSGSKGANSQYDMVVFCHLRWGFVYQRPQHLISRMAKTNKILFVEEPIGFNEGEENEYELEIINDNLHVMKPKVKDIASIKKILIPFLKNSKISTGWFYSAAFSPLLETLEFDTIIYDCMDELSLFKGASPELISQENYLLSKADIVFTGGKSLYESKNKNHNNVYCFPSSVDRKHFEKANLEETKLPQDMEKIKKPIVGYFGVIDERINLDLLQKTAQLQPKVSFVMIGPLAKIGEEDLPREENIHYLGMKSYEDLPAYLKGFDMAMMPFALNDATRFISPTKTLEYMAAGKPIISTAIKDVERDYSHCINIIETAEEFSQAIENLWHVHQPDVSGDYNEILSNTSWDNTANKMQTIIKTVK